MPAQKNLLFKLRVPLRSRPLNMVQIFSCHYNLKPHGLVYLARREPAYGIIILYDEASQVCYYDYVEEIVKRLDDIDTRDGWREQESVTILLPKKVLNENEL